MTSSRLLIPTIKMMNLFSVVLADMEKAGMCIDREFLDKLEANLQNRHKFLKQEINRMAEEALGDQQINMDSPEQLSMLIYSFRLRDKKQWARTFNIGSEVRNSVRKAKRAKYFTAKQLRQIIKEQTEPILKQKSMQCPTCNGKGKIKWVKKDGTPAKRPKNCFNARCVNGVVYTDLDSRAGFGCIPLSSTTATSGGFATSADVLQKLARREKNETTRKFLSYLVEYGKISHNLGTSIDGIRRNIGNDVLLHTQFNQTVAATGRLSSTSPNIHNWQRGDSFPIRRCVVSRWSGGKITKGDFSGLEFRIAVELSGDEQGFKDLESGVDAHARTRDILARHGEPGSRQDAKSHTFKPLYGGTSGTRAQIAYYQFFYKQYPGIQRWHEHLQDTALSKGRLIIPSGRIYEFPDVFRYSSGAVSKSTQIKNYPVQGFATADIVPIATIETWYELRKRKLKSLIINEVHDEIDIDTHPDEVDIIPKLLYDCMMKVPQLLKKWYNYDIRVELPVEIQQGDNWLDVKLLELA